MAARQITYLFTPGSEIELITCANSDLSYPLHNHVNVFAIGLLIQGSVQLTLNGRVFSVVKNQTFIVPPYAPHSIQAKDEYSLLTICIDKKMVEQNNEKYLQAIAKQTLSEAIETKRLNHAQLVLFLEAVSACKSQALMIDLVSKDYVQKTRQLIEQYPECSLTIAELSDQFSVSKYHLIHMFKQEVGLTPHQFHIQNRVRKAQRLLYQPMSITDVALNAGFYDQSHLIRHFKRMLGLSPSAYRAACLP